LNENKNIELEELEKIGQEEDIEKAEIEVDEFSDGHISESSDFFMEAMER